MKETDEMRTRLYKASGIAAMIPGLQYAIDALQATIDGLRGELAELQGMAPLSAQAIGGRYGWSLDPKERKREMQRRMEITKTRRVNDPQHPDHSKWVVSVRKARKRYWASLSARQRKQLIEKMQAGRRASAAQRINGKEATE